jgi:hypothetical protein
MQDAGGWRVAQTQPIDLADGCMGFIATLIGAWLYNVVAGLVGGIEMDLE